MSSDLRPLLFELLSCLSYLRGRMPDEVAQQFAGMEQQACEALGIVEKQATEMMPVQVLPSDLAVDIETLPVQVTQLFLPPGDLPAHRICPVCGDATPKIVHLKKRPRGTLQCQACRAEYPFPAIWGLRT